MRWRIWIMWTSVSEACVTVRAETAEEALEVAHRMGVAWGLGIRQDYLGCHAQRVI